MWLEITKWSLEMWRAVKFHQARPQRRLFFAKDCQAAQGCFPEAMSNLITWCQQSEAITESPDSLIARFLHWLHCKPSTCFVLLKWLKCDSEITWMVFWFGLSRCLEFLQLHQQPDSASATANKRRLGTFYTLGRLTTVDNSHYFWLKASMLGMNLPRCYERYERSGAGHWSILHIAILGWPWRSGWTTGRFEKRQVLEPLPRRKKCLSPDPPEMFHSGTITVVFIVVIPLFTFQSTETAGVMLELSPLESGFG